MDILDWLVKQHEKDVAKRLTPKGKGKQPLKPERYDITLHNGRKISFGE